MNSKHENEGGGNYYKQNFLSKTQLHSFLADKNHEKSILR